MSLDREGGDTEVDDASSSDEDLDFDGGLDTRVWNRMGAFPRFLSALRSNAPSFALPIRTALALVISDYSDKGCASRHNKALHLRQHKR
jgi:hypothetical protein